MAAKFFTVKTTHNKSGYSIGGDVTSDRNYKRERELQSTPIELAKNAARKGQDVLWRVTELYVKVTVGMLIIKMAIL